MEDGALSWLVGNLNTASASTRRHLELSICHLAQNGNFFYPFSFHASTLTALYSASKIMHILSLV